ncbi:MAG TPA: DUF1330 domain-containing protein [Vicinamibacterales bacterium]|nr:DUF1330 domain-containing protein [Vicinamibacterales bacterium]
MRAYFVYICQEVVDRSELEIYWSKIGSTLEGYGAGSIAAYTPFEQLEGDTVDGAAVVEFPSMERSPDGGRIAGTGTTDAAHEDAQTT